MLLPLQQAVSVAILNEAGETLFVRRAREDQEFPDCWCLPTARFGPDQSILDAARWTARSQVGVEVGQLRWLNSDIDVRDFHRLKLILRPGIDPGAVEHYRLLIHVVEAHLESAMPARLPRYPEHEWRQVEEYYTHQQAYTLYHAGQMGDGTRVYLEWKWEMSLQE